MIDQKKEIEEGDWDCLLVLDACRFDYLEDTYECCLKGDLKRAKSPVSAEDGIATSEWCKRVFTEQFEDIIYISTTPHVNSRTEVNGFKGGDHFFKVVDLWDHGWDDEMGTVMPGRVNVEVLKTREEHPEKRIIAHYMQPHFPYLSLGSPENPKSKDPGARNGLNRKIREIFGSRIRKVLGGELTRRIMRGFGMESINPMHEILNRQGEKKLKKAYRENLGRVLESISELADEIEGKMVVTADHGEYLGEDGFYGHSYLPDHPVLQEVPWLEIEWSEDPPSR